MSEPTFSCPKCGYEMLMNRGNAEEVMEIHRKECSGKADPRDRFEIGDRVEIGEYGHRRLPPGQPNQPGEVVDFGAPRHEHIVHILWDGRETAEPYAHRFLVLADGGDA